MLRAQGAVETAGSNNSKGDTQRDWERPVGCRYSGRESKREFELTLVNDTTFKTESGLVSLQFTI